jgi:tetratricopeptide (TPR) repeat protein
MMDAPEPRSGAGKIATMSCLGNMPAKMAAALALAACLGGACNADTIVLKNGRRIVVSNVTRAAGKVSGDTPAGRLSLPDSMVARVEKDDASAGPGTTTNLAAADLPIAPPPAAAASDSDPAARAVVRDGAIDQEALARFDSQASSGNAEAVARAVAAESAASQFEFGRGNIEQALGHAERALSLSPDQVTLLLNVAYLHLRRSEYSVASDLLDRARRLAPDSPDVAKLSGWVDYGLNRLPQAVEEWKRAQQLRPDPEVASALERAERDAQVETNFEEGVSAHFVLRYDGSAAPDLARAVLNDLENDFASMVSLFDYTPAEPVAVILYTNQDFADITRAPAWVGAINDGRIRVPVQGVLAVTPELASDLRHELAHSFISQKTHGNCAIWLHEGIAQWAEGKRSKDDAALLVDLYDRHDDPSLAALEKSWLAMPADVARISYGWSLATVEAIVDAGTTEDLDRLLDALASGSSTEGAVRSVLHDNYADLNRSTADYLRRIYQH